MVAYLYITLYTIITDNDNNHNYTDCSLTFQYNMEQHVVSVI